MDLGPGRRSLHIVAVAALFALAALLFAAAASAEVRSGSATDGVEPLRLQPGQDIVAASASYDTNTGTISAAVTTAGPPLSSESMALGVAFGTLEGGECVAPIALLLGLYEDPSSAAWISDTEEGPAAKGVAGSTTTMTASGAALIDEPYDCVQTIVFEIIGEELKSIEGLASPMLLAAPPPPPPPSSPPPPSPPPAPPAPTPPPPPKVAKLSLGSAKTLTLRRGKWKKVKLKVKNEGTARAARVTLKLGKAKGVAVKPKSGKLKLKSIAPGKSKTASFKLLLTKKAKATSTIALTLTGAKGVKLKGALSIQAWKKGRGHKGGKGKGEPPVASPLTETLFWAYEEHPSESASLIGYAFLDETWAYHGIPAGGLPNCTGVTGSAEKEGCVKYSYDPKTGAVQIGSLDGGKILADGSLEIDGEKYSPTYIPPAGTRYQVEQEYGGYYGLCGLITGCSTWFEHLLLTSSGEFVLSHQSTTTIGGSGPGETFIAAGNYPPDQHGTYAIEPRGRIRFSYADGSVKTRTIAILLNQEGKPDPVNEGLLLDSDYFNFLPDD